jgi:branched-chain amino acid transport system permease protein
MNICINIILAVSLNLIIGFTGQFSLGHAGFMAIGAYGAAIVLLRMPNIWGLIIGSVVGMIIAGASSLIVAIPTLRLRGDYLAIATLGFSEIIRIILVNGGTLTNGAAGLSNIPKKADWTIAFVMVMITIVVVSNIIHSKTGRNCIAIREDEIAAEAMGVNTTKFKVIAFVIGAMLAALGGSLYASNFYVIKPSLFTFTQSVNVLIVVVFGGIGSITGSVIGAIVLGILTTVLQDLAYLRMIVYAVVLIIIMIFRPSGLLGNHEFTMTGLFRLFHKKPKGGLTDGQSENE